jgi:hypothetical protein
VLWAGSPQSSDAHARNAIFRRRLHELGYTENNTVTILDRFADGQLERLPVDRGALRPRVLCLFGQLPDRYENAIIIDVEATTANRQAEVLAAKRMVERSLEHFDLYPERLIGDSPHGRDAPKAAVSRLEKVLARAY